MKTGTTSKSVTELVHAIVDAHALEDANTAAARLRSDPSNNRALTTLYNLCREHGLQHLAVDAPDCDGALMAEASLRIRARVFSFGPCLAKPC